MISPINEISSRTIRFIQQWTHCCWHNHKMTEMPRLADYLDVVFLSPTWEVITSGHCRKILPSTSQNGWNVDQVDHKHGNLWLIMCTGEYLVCLMVHFANNSEGIQEIPLFSLVDHHRNTAVLAFDPHPAQFAGAWLSVTTKDCQIPWCKTIICLQEFLLYIRYRMNYIANISYSLKFKNVCLWIVAVIALICHWNKFNLYLV